MYQCDTLDRGKVDWHQPSTRESEYTPYSSSEDRAGSLDLESDPGTQDR